MTHDDTSTAKDALTTLGVGPAAKELYVDMLRPAAIEMGQNLVVAARLVTIALAPLHGAVWGLERVRDWLSAALLKRLARVKPEQIQAPPLYLAGQVVLHLPFYAEQEHLRELFANLLASSMNTQTVAQVHPAFVQIIQQITPDEALLLEALGTKALGIHEIHDDKGHYHSEAGESISRQFRRICEQAGVSSPELSDAYLDNLLRLKILIEESWSEGTFHPSGHNRYGEYEAFIENRSGRLVDLSNFGDRFLEVCVRPPRDNPETNTDT